MEAGIESRRLAIEIIATLVNMKGTMAEMLLKPAGVPVDVYRTLINQRDDITGKPRSKRQVAPLILDALLKRSDCSNCIRSLVEIAANWSDFHLAQDEFAARATVQKAREFLGQIELLEERERA